MKFELLVRKNTPEAQLPVYQTEGSLGADLRSVEDVVIQPGKRALVDTGLSFKVTDGFFCDMQIRPRSGLAAKNGVTVLNAPGTIDMDYRGPVKVILINLGDEPFEVKVGDRIAQLVTLPMVEGIREVSELDETQRGEGGFGSTGKD